MEARLTGETSAPPELEDAMARALDEIMSPIPVELNHIDGVEFPAILGSDQCSIKLFANKIIEEDFYVKVYTGFKVPEVEMTWFMFQPSCTMYHSGMFCLDTGILIVKVGEEVVIKFAKHNLIPENLTMSLHPGDHIGHIVITDMYPLKVVS